MAKKFNLKINNQKELQTLARVESIYNINYDELNIVLLVYHFQLHL